MGGAFAEARYFGWEALDSAQKVPIKGRSLDAAKILGSEERAKPKADDASCGIARARHPPRRKIALTIASDVVREMI
jgi:hypothetical protein